MFECYVYIGPMSHTKRHHEMLKRTMKSIINRVVFVIFYHRWIIVKKNNLLETDTYWVTLVHSLVKHLYYNF